MSLLLLLKFSFLFFLDSFIIMWLEENHFGWKFQCDPCLLHELENPNFSWGEVLNHYFFK